MESATFRKWLEERGCRFDQHEHQQRHHGPVMVTIHREGRSATAPLGGSRQALDPRDVRRVCEGWGWIGPNSLGRKAASERSYAVLPIPTGAIQQGRA